MSARYFYRDDSLPSSDSDSDYHEVQYSSSSVDRSSIGSIPWADDAIKQNQLDWERVERMFRGEQSLADAEPELRTEILEWHKKFPNILRSQRPPERIDKFSSLSFTSDDERNYEEEDDEDEDDADGAITPTNSGPSSMYQTKLSAKSLEPLPAKQKFAHEKLISMLANDLRISSVPMAVRRLQQNATTQELNISGRRAPIRSRGDIPAPVVKYNEMFDSSSASNPDQSLSKNGSSSATFTRMPPILKVIEAKNTFRDAHTKHKSFVQLTAPSQAQSAAVTTRRRRWFPQQAIANGQINKNAIILPAINMQRIHETVPLVGRSISAAFNHRQMSWTYLPYSAAKFKLHK